MAQDTTQNNNSSTQAAPAAPAAAPAAAPVAVNGSISQWQLKPGDFSIAGQRLSGAGVVFDDPLAPRAGSLNLNILPREPYDANRYVLPPRTFAPSNPSNPLRPSFTTEVPFLGTTEFNAHISTRKPSVSFRITF